MNLLQNFSRSIAKHQQNIITIAIAKNETGFVFKLPTIEKVLI
jgi:hypothetical protein